MVDVAQSVRASDCGSESRGFEPHLPPEKAFFGRPFFIIRYKLSRICHSECTPKRENAPKFCQDIETRNRYPQSPNKPHTFAITVFANKEYDKYRPLRKLAPIKNRNRRFIEFWQTSRLIFRVTQRITTLLPLEHIKEKGSAIIRLPSLFISRGDKIRTCDHTPPRRVL